MGTGHDWIGSLRKINQLGNSMVTTGQKNRTVKRRRRDKWRMNCPHLQWSVGFMK